ncbi:MAG: BrnT family toxin [Bryobacteraceae bacterium]
MNYEWDAGKAAANFKKHGVRFEEAATVFLDPLAITYSDPGHSMSEHREITIGHTGGQVLLFVAHIDRKGRIRIVSARRATRAERKQYEES